MAGERVRYWEPREPANDNEPGGWSPNDRPSQPSGPHGDEKPS